MRAGYIKLSPMNPPSDTQLQALQKAGCEKAFRDNAGAKRPQWEKCLSTLQAGDTLVLWRLDSLATSLSDVIKIINELGKRKVQLLSLSEPINSTAASTSLFHIFNALSQCERNQVRERFRTGMAAAKNRGVRSGPKFKLKSEQLAQAKALIDQGQSRENVAELLGISRSTLYRHLQRDGAQI